MRFDANVAPGLGWRFEPVQPTVEVKVGENALAFYRATNTSDRPLRGTATYNVLPERAAVFFNKLECFCFKEQLLEPGQTAEFPVSFFVDPQMVGDRDARTVTHITLSYTFHPVAAPGPGVAEKRNDKAGWKTTCREHRRRWPIPTPSITTTIWSIRAHGRRSAPPSPSSWPSV